MAQQSWARGRSVSPATLRSRVCRTCGVELTPLSYSGWTQCSVCYWRGRLEGREPLELLLKRRGDVKKRLADLPTYVDDAKAVFEKYRSQLEAKASWWRKLLALPVRDDTLAEYGSRYRALMDELGKLRRELDDLNRSIRGTRETKKRLQQAEAFRAASVKRRALEGQRHEAFTNQSEANLNHEFSRELYYMQPRDYRRGNAIDNYFRNRIPGVVFDAFDHRCVFCGSGHDLTLDHYELTKNEGGNYVLISRDKASIRVNIVVLCRSCNSEKGQLSFVSHFGASTRKSVAVHQSRLLQVLLADQAFMRIIKEWAKGSG